MNDLYLPARSAFLGGEIDWAGDTIKGLLLSSAYTYNSSHQFLTSVSGSAVAPAVTLAGCTILAGGVADADDLSVTGVDLGETAEAVVLYKDTGVAGTSPLIYFADLNDDSTGILRPGDGSPVVVVWSNGANRIFRL